MLPDEKASSASTFLRQAVLYFARLGILPRRVMTDNGPCFCSNLFAQICRQFQIKLIRTRFYTPRTNGKAPNASSRPLSANGPMLGSTKTLPTASPTSHLGFTSTTGIVLTPALATARPSADPLSMYTSV
jgi:transposase InsO family protein